MNWSLVRAYVVRYSVLGAGLTLVALYAFSMVSSVTFQSLAILVVLVSLVVLPLLVGATDTGIETVSAGAEVGFDTTDSPQTFQPDASLPGILGFAFYFAGLLVGGVAVLGVALA